MRQVFQRPLIVGASVSADYRAPSPGKTLALRYTNPENIRVVAQNRRHGRDLVRQLDRQSILRHSAVIGIVLFFWDSFHYAPQESLKAMSDLRDLVHENRMGTSFMLAESI